MSMQAALIHSVVVAVVAAETFRDASDYSAMLQLNTGHQSGTNESYEDYCIYPGLQPPTAQSDGMNICGGQECWDWLHGYVGGFAFTKQRFLSEKSYAYAYRGKVEEGETNRFSQSTAQFIGDGWALYVSKCTADCANFKCPGTYENTGGKPSDKVLSVANCCRPTGKYAVGSEVRSSACPSGFTPIRSISTCGEAATELYGDGEQLAATEYDHWSFLRGCGISLMNMFESMELRKSVAFAS
eukprot:TRINITY_DN11898_c0_g1_i1.p1 TRINITY_DN11898_c0_g1~~TRINITY_DN11898_c0_g1_i1.p1  ORF type:complete len:242 (-),score=27.89 TRINITY_DN11898_c0_g1_i1:705-1430(-)